MLMISSGQIYTESPLSLFLNRNGFKMRGLLKKPLRKLPYFIRATSEIILMTIITVLVLIRIFSPIKKDMWVLYIFVYFFPALVNNCTKTFYFKTL